MDADPVNADLIQNALGIAEGGLLIFKFDAAAKAAHKLSPQDDFESMKRICSRDTLQQTAAEFMGVSRLVVQYLKWAEDNRPAWLYPEWLKQNAAAMKNIIQEMNNQKFRCDEGMLTACIQCNNYASGVAFGSYCADCSLNTATQRFQELSWGQLKERLQSPGTH
jgi:hypothetical protein